MAGTSQRGLTFFDADRFGRLALGLEGGHSVRRVVHAGGSATGRRVVRQLSALAAENPRITVLEEARAGALWRSGDRCRGLLCEDGRTVTGLISAETANSITLLQSGGVAEEILRGDIESLRSSNLSVMPEGLEQTLSPQDLAAVASAGLAALDALEHGGNTDDAWKAQQSAAVQEALKPKGQLLLMPAAAIQKLIDAASAGGTCAASRQ